MVNHPMRHMLGKSLFGINVTITMARDHFKQVICSFVTAEHEILTKNFSQRKIHGVMLDTLKKWHTCPNQTGFLNRRMTVNCQLLQLAANLELPLAFIVRKYFDMTRSSRDHISLGF